MTAKPNVKWEGLIRTVKAGKEEYKVVREAEGIAPGGFPIKAERIELDTDNVILISLPEQNDWILAVLDGTKWDIVISPSGELYVVNTIRGNVTAGAIADEYLMLTQANDK